MAYIDRDRLAYFLSKLKLWVQDNAASKALATPYSDGLMPAADKAKLNALIVDDALSTASVNPVQNRVVSLAVQGLGDRMTAVEQQAASAFKFKGAVEAFNDLPSTGNQPGDMWSVQTGSEAGNWAWDGTQWVKVSDVVDLSNYATKDVATALTDGLMSSGDKVNLDALMAGLVPAWASGVDYPAYALVKGSDGLLYYSQGPSGPGTAAGAQNPVYDSAGLYWKKLASDDAGVVHKSGAETVTGQKTFDQTILGNAQTASGFRAWSASEAYAVQDIVKHGGFYWAAAQASSSLDSHEPGTDAWWTKISANDGNVVHRTGDETIYGKKTFADGIDANADTASGFRTWDNAADYAAGETVRGSDGVLYRSLLASGPSGAGAKAPGASGSEAYWVPEVPVTKTYVSAAGSRSAEIPANGSITVSQFTVGAGQILVFLDGVQCVEGVSYNEYGAAGTLSTTLVFLQRIPTDMDILVRVN
jgi:hypothetical protein